MIYYREVLNAINVWYNIGSWMLFMYVKQAIKIFHYIKLNSLLFGLTEDNRNWQCVRNFIRKFAKPLYRQSFHSADCLM